MASGKLGTADLAAATNTSIYTVPALGLSTVNVSLTNQTAAAIAIRLYFATANPPTISEAVYYDTEVPANGVLSYTGEAMAAASIVVAYAAAIGISCNVSGMEEVA